MGLLAMTGVALFEIGKELAPCNTTQIDITLMGLLAMTGVVYGKA